MNITKELTHLEAKVEARNKISVEHNRLLPLLHAAFAPLVGKKILKADGTFLASLGNLMPELSPTMLMSYKLSSEYSLAFVIRVCVSCERGGCVYDEATVYVGDMDSQVLKGMIAPQPLPTGYTVQQVLDARRNLEEAKKNFSKAEAALWPFTSFDR